LRRGACTPLHRETRLVEAWLRSESDFISTVPQNKILNSGTVVGWSVDGSARLAQRPHLSARLHGEGGKFCCLLGCGGLLRLRGRAVSLPSERARHSRRVCARRPQSACLCLHASGQEIRESAAQRAHRPPHTTPSTAGHTFSSAPARAGLCSPRPVWQAHESCALPPRPSRLSLGAGR
jgi:hypothetical protein